MHCHYRWMLALFTALMLGIANAQEGKFHRLTAMELRSKLVGKVVTDESHWADKFLPDGALAGHQLGKPQTGSWKITRQGEVCVVRQVKTAESDCFEVWVRDNNVEYRRTGIVLSEGILKDEW